jgi:hypothetical protein
MDRFNTNGAPPVPGDTDEMQWKYCRVLPHSETKDGCILESFVFLKADSQETWVPCRPESLRWSFRVSGIVSGIPDTTLDVPESAAGQAGQTELEQNYPNPFNPSTTIRFTLAAPQHVSVGIYDVSGRLVRTLISEVLPAGMHVVVWDGRDDSMAGAASGVYFCRIEAAEGVRTKKLVLVR